jgi:hypothetical protein
MALRNANVLTGIISVPMVSRRNYWNNDDKTVESTFCVAFVLAFGT